MSEEYSKIEVRRSMQGRSLPDSIKRAVKDYFNKSALSENECKDRLASLLGGNNKYKRDGVYKKVDISSDDKKRIEAMITSN